MGSDPIARTETCRPGCWAPAVVDTAGCVTIDGLGSTADDEGDGPVLGFGDESGDVRRAVGRGVGRGVGLGVGRGVGVGVVPGLGLCEALGAAAIGERDALPSTCVLASADAPKPAVSANATASDTSHSLVGFDIDRATERCRRNACLSATHQYLSPLDPTGQGDRGIPVQSRRWQKQPCRRRPWAVG
jgi:hypothetical protein